MADLTDGQIDAALERGARARNEEPRAIAARYDRQTGRLSIELANECTISFPAHSIDALAEATDEDLSAVEMLGAGYGLHWETLDVDLSIPGLLAGMVGTGRHMARHAGRATSPAKAAAARENGRKGGRPRRSAAG